MMTRSTALWIVLALLTAVLAGCIGDTGDGIEASDASPGTEASPNPWQAGLADDHPPPDVAEHRSRDERRSNLAEPGDPTFAGFDAAFKAFMESHDLPTGQVAVMHEGALRYTRGYGYADKGGTERANASTMFRIASITKPMPAAVVSMQVEQGMYNWSDPVFCVPPDPAPDCLLPIEPHPDFPVEDEDLGDVTVRHLIDHTGGWGRSMDHVFFGNSTIEIAEKMGIQTPPPAWRLAQYLMGQPIEDKPGERYWYCNACYMLAGLIAEAETGASMQTLYDAYLFEPLEIEDDIEISRTLPDERNPREPFYACEYGKTPSVFDPNETVCWPDGGFSVETARSVGGVVATASAVAAVYELYAHHGFTRVEAGPVSVEGHTGGIPGTATMTGVIEDGDTATGKTQYVALFNKQGGDEIYFPASHSYRFEQPLLALTAAWGASENLQDVAG